MTSKFLTNSINWLRKSVSDAEHLASITGDSTPPMPQNGGKCVIMGTVWKFQNFTATQILREIKFDKFCSSRTAILVILKAPNFDF